MFKNQRKKIVEYLKILGENFRHNTQMYFKKLGYKFERSLGFPFLQNPNSYEDLTPKIIDDNTYVDAINWALQNKDIKNIAVTGAYGSGKSSVLKTLKNKHTQYNYVNISLATFEDLEQGEELNKKIELSILQQLLYLEKSQNIPNSRFKKIKNFKKRNILSTTMIWFLVALSYILLFQKNYINQIPIYKELNKHHLILENIALIIFVSGFLYILSNFIKALSNFKFEKINFKGDIELNREDKETSILNKNLDEIIYFFEKTKYNVVIIEDLDRFKEPLIFTRLREINLLINNSKQVNRHITFIYALIDSMFTDGNRTKFFDFFVPIIPVINSSNSFEKLSTRLKDEEISHELIYDVSLYIEDMRLLINIVNEFKIYKKKLIRNINLSPDKLFAFVIYKNKYPEDFAALSDNKGFVYLVFNTDINTIQQSLAANAKFEIGKIEKRINKVENFKIESINNLRKLYILELIKILPNEKDLKIILSQSFAINDIENLIQNESFDKIKNTEQINYSFSQYNRSYDRFDTVQKTITFSDVEKSFDIGESFQDKEALVIERERDEIDGYYSQINKLKSEINRIKGLSLHELLEAPNASNKLNEEIKKHKILIYFLRNELITKDYFDYISIFYEGSITRNDKNFILSIRDSNPLDINFQLNKIDGILKHIKNDFGKSEILNISLVDYLFKTQNLELLRQLFNQYHNIQNRLLTFTDEYVIAGKYPEKFYQMICFYWIDFWKYVQNNSSFNQEMKDNILVQIIIHADATDLISQNKGNLLSEYISNKSDFFLRFDEGDKKVEKIIPLLKVRFTTKLNEKTSNHFLNFVYDNNLYDFQIDIIKQLIKKVENLDDEEVEKLERAHFSTLLLNKCNKIINYAETAENINDYLKNIFLVLETNIEETESTILRLLNNKDILPEIKTSIINKNKAKVTELELVVDTSLWDELMISNSILPTWKNIYQYYLECGMNESLVYFLNNNENSIKLSKVKIFYNINGEDVEKHSFIEDLLTNDEISENAYDSLCKSISHVYSKLTYDKIDDYKINKIIENKIIKFSVENFNLLKQNSTNGHIILIEENFVAYLEIRDEFLLEVNDYKLLLTSAKLTEENKIELIGELEEEDIKPENNLAEILSELFVKFRQIELNYTFLRKTLQNTKNVDSKIIIFNKYFQVFSGDISKTDEILSLLGYPYSQLPLKWKKLKFIKNKYNKEFFAILESIKYPNISSINDESESITIFTKRK